MAQAVTEKIRVPHLYTPREYQHSMLGFLGAGYKRYVGIWHRRAGKDKSAINLIVSEMVKNVGAYYYFFPTYNQAKKVIWDGIDPRTGLKYLDHFPKQLQSKEPNKTEMKIEFTNGSLFQLVGTDNFNSIMGTNPRGCVFSEYSLQDPRAWDYIRPILRENKGWAAFIYTPRGKNHGWQLYRMAQQESDWYTEILTVRDTKREDGSPVVSQEDVEKDRTEGMDDDLIEQEYYCSFEGSIQGAYYSKQLKAAREEKRITSIPIIPTIPIDTFWDLGINDTMALWFMQPVGKELRFVDYYENSNEGLSHYAKILKDKGYLYGDHYMPHDAAHRSIQTGQTTQVIAEGMGIKPIRIVNRAKDSEAVNGGIEAARNIFPLCWFDEKRCNRGLMALENYHKEYDEEKKVFHNRPFHDWSSNGSDGFRTFAVGYKEKTKPQTPKPRSHSANDWMGV